MFVNPYHDFKNKELLELKTNFHTHADGLDGCAKYSLQDTFEAYAEAGYKAFA